MSSPEGAGPEGAGLPGWASADGASPVAALDDAAAILRLALGLGFGGDLGLPLAALLGERSPGRRRRAGAAPRSPGAARSPPRPGAGAPRTPRWRPAPPAVGLRAAPASLRAHGRPRRTRRASPPTNRWPRRRARRRRRRRWPPRRRRGAGSDRPPSSRTCGPPSPRDRTRKAATSDSSVASSAFVDSISTAS